ncbi:MAG: Hint domain-containing protein [Pseudomonadota bacterium]
MAFITQDIIRRGGGTADLGPREAQWEAPGFGPLTRIATSFGEVHAQALRERDMVRAQSGRLHEITEIDRLKLDAAFLEMVPEANPVVIRAGALGGGLPKADVVVSAGQIIGTGRHAAETRFCRAGDLVGRPGIIRRPEEIMTYTNLMCSGPLIVRVEGIWAKLA